MIKHIDIFGCEIVFVDEIIGDGEIGEGGFLNLKEGHAHELREDGGREEGVSVLQVLVCGDSNGSKVHEDDGFGWTGGAYH